eukprot:767048-Hanusia_phi.AAC.4
MSHAKPCGPVLLSAIYTSAGPAVTRASFMASATYCSSSQRRTHLRRYLSYIHVVSVQASHGEAPVLGAVDVPLVHQDVNVLGLSPPVSGYDKDRLDEKLTCNPV